MKTRRDDCLFRCSALWLRLTTAVVVSAAATAAPPKSKVVPPAAKPLVKPKPAPVAVAKRRFHPPVPKWAIKWGPAYRWPEKGWAVGLSPYRVGDFVYKGKTLHEAVADISRLCGPKIVWASAPVAQGLNLAIVTANFYRVPAHYALVQLLKPYGLEAAWNGTVMVVQPIQKPSPPVSVEVQPAPAPVSPLDRVGSFDFRNKNLRQAGAELSTHCGLRIAFGPRSAAWLDHPAHLQFPAVTVRVALNKVLGQYGLKWQHVGDKVQVSASTRVSPPSVKPTPPAVRRPIPRRRPLR